jgi:CRISPR/Cas system-associated exonuclease Cas4 (RecB family)
MQNQITSWSYSRYADYSLCPLKAKLKHIDKIKEPPNEAMARGSAIHKQAENYIKGGGRNLPAELKGLGDEFKALRKLYKKRVQGVAAVEDSWSFRADWSTTTWNDWTGCWLRVKADCAHYTDPVTLVVTDWKTGKLRPEEAIAYGAQLELQALAAFLQIPTIERVIPRLGYIDIGVFYPQAGDEIVYTRKDIPKLKAVWLKRTKSMLNDKRFAPRPNNKCRWCFYRKENNGPCKY